MIASTTGKQAVRALIAMAAGEAGRTWSLKDLAEAGSVGAPYLGKTLRRLAQAGIVTLKRGRGGGVRLARPSGQVSLFQILDALGEMESLSECALGLGECSPETPCALHDVWTELRRRTLTYMKTTTLDELASRDRTPVSARAIARDGTRGGEDST